jgi:hypothetical protein
MYEFAHDRLNRCNSFSKCKCLSFTVRCLVNMKVVAPKIGAFHIDSKNKMTIFSKKNKQF